MVISEMISSGHARALLAIEDLEQQHNIAMRVFDEKLSVRDIEKLVKDMNRPLKKKKTKEELDFIYRDLEEKMKISMGTKVSINAKSDGKGKIEIDYYSVDELDRLVELLIHINK
jgi:ParB family transcriptional regulator, chromosome partitioning protein